MLVVALQAQHVGAIGQGATGDRRQVLRGERELPAVEPIPHVHRRGLVQPGPQRHHLTVADDRPGNRGIVRHAVIRVVSGIVDQSGIDDHRLFGRLHPLDRHEIHHAVFVDRDGPGAVQSTGQRGVLVQHDSTGRGKNGPEPLAVLVHLPSAVRLQEDV